MKRAPINKAKAKLKVFLLFLLVAYLFTLVGKTVYENYKFNKELKGLADETKKLEEDNKKLKEDIEYFKTDEYKEKQAREKLNKQKPGESVIVITPDGKKAPKVEVNKEEDPNYLKWWKFLTHTLDS